MKCPRCGFEQPQDRFCAQCGLDVERYKPSTRSALVALSGSVPFRTVTVVVLGLLSGWLIYQRKRLPVVATTPLQVQEAVPESAPAPNTPTAASPVAPAESGRQSPSVANKNSTPPAEEKSETQKTAAVRVSGLKISAVAVPTVGLTALLENSKSVGSSGSAKALWLKSLSLNQSKLRDSDWNELESALLILQDSPVTWDKMLADSGAELGLLVVVQPPASDPSRFSIKIERHLRETKGEPKEPFNWSVDDLVVTQPGEALVLSSILPRRKLHSDEIPLLNSPLFRVMETREYQEGLLEVLLVIEPQTDTY